MSIYTECRDATLALLSNPDRKGLYSNREGVFTKMDIILLASGSSPRGLYSDTEVKEAHREASQVLTGLFNSRQIVRYGPVMLTALGLDEPDYARLGAQIIHASAEYGPPILQTPNGDFPQMFKEDDTIGRSGRRLGSKRDDFIPWPDQAILDEPVAHDPDEPPPKTPQDRTIIRQRAQIATLEKKLRAQQVEISRLRDHIAAGSAKHKLVPHK